MPNYRGNVYSRRHLTKDPNKPTSGFWNFSWKVFLNCKFTLYITILFYGFWFIDIGMILRIMIIQQRLITFVNVRILRNCILLHILKALLHYWRFCRKNRNTMAICMPLVWWHPSAFWIILLYYTKYLEFFKGLWRLIYILILIVFIFQFDRRFVFLK